MFCCWQKAGLWRIPEPPRQRFSCAIKSRFAAHAAARSSSCLASSERRSRIRCSELADAAGECFDVGGGTEPGGFPSSLSKRFRQRSFEPGDVRGQTAVAGREVRDVGQQRLAADLRSGRRAGRRLARSGENGRVQVTVPVDQTAVDVGGAGNGGDGDLLAVRGQLVEKYFPAVARASPFAPVTCPRSSTRSASQWLLPAVPPSGSNSWRCPLPSSQTLSATTTRPPPACSTRPVEPGADTPPGQGVRQEPSPVRPPAPQVSTRRAARLRSQNYRGPGIRPRSCLWDDWKA